LQYVLRHSKFLVRNSAVQVAQQLFTADFAFSSAHLQPVKSLRIEKAASRGQAVKLFAEPNDDSTADG